MTGLPLPTHRASADLIRHLPPWIRGLESAGVPGAVGRMRPAKVRNAVRRRWFERRLGAVSLTCAPGLCDLGSDYGAWRVPSGLIGDGWTCYSAGAGGDVSFDLELIRRFGATVRSIEPVGEFVEAAREEAGDEPRFTALHAALATVDGPLLMQRSHDEHSRSVSSAGLYESDSYVELPGRTLTSLMAELGDGTVELLKMDLEGAEYEVLPTLELRELGVKVLAVQLHHVGSVRQARGLLAELNRAGYDAVACRAPVKLTFARRDLL